MLGKSFAPITDPNNPQQAGSGQNRGGNQAQQAIKVLNLRIPRVVGAGGGAPQPLLTSPGSGALPMSAQTFGGYVPGGQQQGGNAQPFGIEQLIAALFSGGASAPDPNIGYLEAPAGSSLAIAGNTHPPNVTWQNQPPPMTGGQGGVQEWGSGGWGKDWQGGGGPSW